MHATRSVRLLSRNDVFVMATLDGSDTLYSYATDETYHSIKGAVSESRHVFIQHGLMQVFHSDTIHILEFGFGTGLNAFLAYLLSKKHHKKISYTGIEKFPLELAVAEQLNYPQYLAAPRERQTFLKMHSQSEFRDEYFEFRKVEAIEELHRDTLFDCIFFDAFAPSVQPELWDFSMMHQLFAHTSAGGCITTYSAQGKVRRAMEAAGYTVMRIAGAPGKRHMLQAFRS